MPTKLDIMLGAEGKGSKGRETLPGAVSHLDRNSHGWNSGELLEKIVEARGRCVRHQAWAREASQRRPVNIHKHSRSQSRPE